MSRADQALLLPAPAQVTLVGMRGAGVHPWDSDYVARFSAPMLGPTSCMLLFLMNREWDVRGEPFTVEVVELAGALGVKPNVLRHAFDRLVRFRVGSWDATRETFYFLTHLEPVPTKYVAAATFTPKGTTP